jgi:glycosyltransferase involved in cell wall biosynthesis
MRIYIVGKQKLIDHNGGGFSFVRNFIKGCPFEIVEDPKDCDIFFIPSASMYEKGMEIPIDKKVVLRVDNALKNSRNRNAGMRRMCEIASKADLIVYQSKWSQEYLSPVINACRVKETVIVNGSDTKIFKPEGLVKENTGSPLYLYVRSSNDETKQWHQSWYEFQMIQRRQPNAELWIAGRFSPENHEYNFDFFNNENYKYLGFVQSPEDMACLYRTAEYLLFPFFNDSCSQTLIEFLLTKRDKSRVLFNNNTGGNPDILNSDINNLTIEYMCQKYKEALEQLF